MLKSVDDSAGMIVQKLEELGILENTIVIFHSDNGGVERSGITSNLPLRSQKTHAYEGGVRVPLIVRGPGVVRNGTCDVPVTGPDFFPTFLELAGVTREAVAGLPGLALEAEELDGASLFPLFAGRSASFSRKDNPEAGASADAIFWHVPHYKHSAPYSAVAAGRLKFIRYWEDADALASRSELEGGFHMAERELYELESNIGEDARKNLAESNPEAVRNLERMLFAWLDDVDASMATAVKRTDSRGAVQRWYRTRRAKNGPPAADADPVARAVRESQPGDVITIYTNDIEEARVLRVADALEGESTLP